MIYIIFAFNNERLNKFIKSMKTFDRENGTHLITKKKSK